VELTVCTVMFPDTYLTSSNEE